MMSTKAREVEEYSVIVFFVYYIQILALCALLGFALHVRFV